MAGVYWQPGDLLEPGCATELLQRLRPQYLLHLAWYAVPGEFWEARENLEWLRASLELVQAFADHGGERLVAAGSCAEYDWSGNDWKGTDWNGCHDGNDGECLEYFTPLLPNTLYGASKHALERMLHFCRRQTRPSSAWGRMFFLYGPHEDPRRLVAYVVQ